MIKDVFNSISSSASKSGMLSSNSEAAGKENAGFFGKMLMALQNSQQQADGEAGAESQGQNKEGQATEGGLFARLDQEGAQRKQVQQLGATDAETTEAQEQAKANVQPSGEDTSELDAEQLSGEVSANVETGKSKPEGQESVSQAVKDTSATDQKIEGEVVPANTGKAGEQEVSKNHKGEGAQESSLKTVAKKEGSENVQATENSKVKLEETTTIASGETEDVQTEGEAKAETKNIDAVQQKSGRPSPQVQGMAGANEEASVGLSSKAVSDQKTASVEGTITSGTSEQHVVKGPAPSDGDQKMGSKQPVATEFAQAQKQNPTEGQATVRTGAQPQTTQQEEKVQSGPAQNNRGANQHEAAQAKDSQLFEKDITPGSQTKDALKIQAKESREEREKRYDLTKQNGSGNSLNGERLSAVAGMNQSGRDQQNMSFSGQPNWLKYQAGVQQNSSLSEDQKAFLNEQMQNAGKEVDADDPEKMNLSFSRLNDIPIANATLRRSVMPGLTSAVQKASASAKENPQTWQKHSFELDDGKKIELSTRNVDGVLQVKIASSSPELSKLMQQYGQEIKEHLEKECEVNIDLQFSEDHENEMSGFMGDEASGNNNGSGNNSGLGNSLRQGSRTGKSQEHIQQAVRKFGYNQMEWTA